MFNWENYAFFDISKHLRTTKKIGLEYDNAEITSPEESQATIRLNISVDTKDVDNYSILISYGFNSERGVNKMVYFDVAFSANDLPTVDSAMAVEVKLDTTAPKIAPKKAAIVSPKIASKLSPKTTPKTAVKAPSKTAVKQASKKGSKNLAKTSSKINNKSKAKSLIKVKPSAKALMPQKKASTTNN